MVRPKCYCRPYQLVNTIVKLQVYLFTKHVTYGGFSDGYEKRFFSHFPVKDVFEGG